MTFNFAIPQYCERGGEAALWAEPINVVSNIAFIIAAILAAVMLARKPAVERSRWHYVLIVLAGMIGVGSFLFHIYANMWSLVADVVPIYTFMFCYLIFALAAFLRLPPYQVLAWMAVFILLCYGASVLKCGEDFFGVFPFAVGVNPAGRCLNGSLAYLPALGAMLVIGMIMKKQGHRSAWLLLAAVAVFFASLTFRTIDLDICKSFTIFGQAAGSHSLWHILNATVIFLLLKAAIDGAPARQDHKAIFRTSG